MNFSYISMTNYRQYANTKIDFACSASQNVTIIEGPNGAGKTNILNAITWCLFGDEFHVNKSKGLPILNTTASEKAKDGELVKVSVEIQFINKNNRKINICREIYYKKQKNLMIEIPLPHPPPSVIFEGERDWSKPINGEDAQYWINNMIPPSIEEYFFFDGERMNDYFKQNTGGDIKKAVFKISQLELLDSLINHLSIRRTDFLKTAKGLGSKAQEMREFIELQEQSNISDIEELKKLITQEETSTRVDKELSDQLKNTSLEDIQKLEKKREELRIDLKRIKGEIVEVEDDKLKLLHQKMAVVLCHKALINSKALISNSRAAGKIPPKFETIFIQGLLDKGKCICGTDISEYDEYSLKRRNKVSSLLEESKLSTISSDLIETNGHIEEMLEGLKSFREDVIAFEKRLKSLDSLRASTDEEIKKIGQDLEHSNSESVRNLENQKKQNTESLKALTGKIAILKDRIERRERIIKARRSELTQELKREKKHNNLLEIESFCDQGISCAKEVKEKIMKTVKADIEIHTSEQFLNLIWKKDTFKGVVIDDEYNISVPHVSGKESIGTLSAGERQVCALSFMAALNNVSGFDVPIVIDTPLARISSEPRINIAKNLSDYLGGTQTTMLVTKEEYTPEVQTAISRRVGRVYRIKVDEKEHGNLAEVQILK